jgi:2-polyprenyl-3-methyl-5-hydroxy-6-metoxy-1,4-benzoquinol methylase
MARLKLSTVQRRRRKQPSDRITRCIQRIVFFSQSFLYNSFAKVLECLIIFKQLRLKQGEWICNLGCGLGENDVILAYQGARVHGIDIEKNALNYARDRAHRLGVDVTYSVNDLQNGLGLKTGKFHKVVSYCVLEHLKYPELLLQEVRRILRPGGHIVLSADSFSFPNSPSELRRIHKKVCRVQHYYRKEDMESLLERNGFRVEEVRFFIKSPLSAVLFEMLLRAYFKSENDANHIVLRFFKFFCPVFSSLAAISDYFQKDNTGGYWLAVRAVKM